MSIPIWVFSVVLVALGATLVIRNKKFLSTILGLLIASFGISIPIYHYMGQSLLSTVMVAVVVFVLSTAAIMLQHKKDSEDGKKALNSKSITEAMGYGVFAIFGWLVLGSVLTLAPLDAWGMEILEVIGSTSRAPIESITS